MDVPPEILALLANTQSIDQTLRLQAEERIRFFQNSELRTHPPQLSRADLSNKRVTDFPLLLTSIAVTPSNDRILRQVPLLPLFETVLNST